MVWVSLRFPPYHEQIYSLTPHLNNHDAGSCWTWPGRGWTSLFHTVIVIAYSIKSKWRISYFLIHAVSKYLSVHMPGTILRKGDKEVCCKKRKAVALMEPTFEFSFVSSWRYTEHPNMVLSKTTASDEGVASGAMFYTMYLPLRSSQWPVGWRYIESDFNFLRVWF